MVKDTDFCKMVANVTHSGTSHVKIYAICTYIHRSCTSTIILCNDMFQLLVLVLYTKNGIFSLVNLFVLFYVCVFVVEYLQNAAR